MAKKSNLRSYKPSVNTKYTVKNNYGVYTKDGSYYGEEGRTKDLPKMTPSKVQQVYITKPKAKLQKSSSSAVSKMASNMKPTNVKSARKAAKATVKAAKTASKTANKKARVAKKVGKIAKRTARKVNRIGRK